MFVLINERGGDDGNGGGRGGESNQIESMQEKFFDQKQKKIQI